MGKRIELPIVYRPKAKGTGRQCGSATNLAKPQPAPAKSATPTARQPRAKPSSPVTASPIDVSIAEVGTSATAHPKDQDPAAILVHKRALKAAQMRRWRAKKKGGAA